MGLRGRAPARGRRLPACYSPRSAPPAPLLSSSTNAALRPCVYTRACVCCRRAQLYSRTHARTPLDAPPTKPNERRCGSRRGWAWATTSWRPWARCRRTHRWCASGAAPCRACCACCVRAACVLHPALFLPPCAASPKLPPCPPTPFSPLQRSCSPSCWSLPSRTAGWPSCAPTVRRRLLPSRPLPPRPPLLAPGCERRTLPHSHKRVLTHTHHTKQTHARAAPQCRRGPDRRARLPRPLCPRLPAPGHRRRRLLHRPPLRRRAAVERAVSVFSVSVMCDGQGRHALRGACVQLWDVVSRGMRTGASPDPAPSGRAASSALLLPCPRPACSPAHQRPFPCPRRGVPGVHEAVWALSFLSFYFLYPSTFNILEAGAGPPLGLLGGRG